ncbi:MAG: peptidase MA family metallohydrolase [Candidatus Eisenbacteria bacterium]|nr:peptidase MA family metallohydrolase [Candidatus Eisenbacteria bacterium]
MRCRTLAALCAAVPLVLIPLAQGAGAAPDAAARERLSQGDITVFYRAADARPAERILEVAAARGSSVAHSAGLAKLGPVTIYVASTVDEFRTLTYGGVPDWGAGCAFPDRGVIVLRNPVTAPNPLHMEDVVVHEIAHIAAGRILGGVRVPRWFHEGIAMTLAGEWRLPRSSVLAGAGAGGGLIPLDELAVAFPVDAADAMLAYSESFYAVRFLMEEAGDATPGSLLFGIAAAGSFERGVEALSGRTLEVFERDAMASFRGRFGWGVFLSRWNVMFVALALLLLTGGAVRLVRSRRQLREWELEDRVRSEGTSRGGRRSDSGWH